MQDEAEILIQLQRGYRSTLATIAAMETKLENLGYNLRFLAEALRTSPRDIQLEPEGFSIYGMIGERPIIQMDGAILRACLTELKELYTRKETMEARLKQAGML